MIPALFLAALLAAQPSPVAEPTETRCDYMVQGPSGVERRSSPELHILQQTSGAGPFALGLPATASIQCGRTDIVPAANDWKVLAAGYPLAIVDVSGSELRTAVLEISDGQVRYRFLAGRMTEEEALRIQARLDAFQLHFQR
jgi:hypothetical protein